MNEYLKKVMEFHVAFGHPVKRTPDVSDMKLNVLRQHLIHEEHMELTDALLDEDKVETLDALCDLQYVISGTVIALGFSSVFDAAFTEVHRSNMSKLGPDGKPIYRADGKVLKGPGYSAPKLEGFVK